MSFEIRADRSQQVTTVPAAGSQRSVFSAAATELGRRGVMVFPNGRTLSGTDLRRIGAMAEANREAELRRLTGYPELRLSELQHFLDDFATAARPAHGVRNQQVVVPQELVAKLERQSGYQAGDRFTLETRPAGSAIAPQQPAARPAPTAPVRAPAAPAPPSDAQRLRGELALGLQAFPADPFEGVVWRTLRPHMTREVLNAGFGLGPSPFGDHLVGDVAVTAMGRLPRATVERELRAAIDARYTNLTADERQTFYRHVMGQIDGALENRAAFRMRDQAVQMMRDAATGFTRLAGDSAQLQELSRTLAYLGRSDATTEQREMGARLREGFGFNLDPAVDVRDTSAMAARIRERAGVLGAEARELDGVGPARVAMEMSRHDVREAYMRSAGIEPGSYLADTVQAAQTSGETERKWMGRVQLGAAVFSAVAVGVTTGGTGLPAAVGILTGMGASAVTGAPGLYEAYRAQATAQAGVSAGTMATGSADAAGTNFRIQAATYAVAVAVPGPLMGKVGHAVHALHEPVRHAIAEGALHGALDVIGHSLHGHGHGELGISTDQLSRLETGQRVLGRMSEARRDSVLDGFSRAMNAAGIPRDAEQRTALFATFLAAHGHELTRLDPDRAQTAMERFIRTGR